MSTKPPGPGGFFGLRHLRRMGEDNCQFSVDLATAYGDAVFFRIFGKPVFQFSHPDACHEILVTKAKSFKKTPRNRAIFKQWIGNGSVISEGKQWEDRRRCVQPAMSPDQIRVYTERVAWLVSRTIGRCSSPVLNLRTVMSEISLFSVIESLFGNDVETDSESFRQAMDTLNNVAYRQFTSKIVLPTWFPTQENRRIRDTVKFLKQIVQDSIERRRAQQKKKNDLLGMLLDHQSSHADIQLSLEAVKEEALTMLVAGHDTTATTMTWAIYLLAKHPDVQQEVAKEIDEHCGTSLPTPDDLAQLELVKMVVQESMRLYPAVYVLARQAVESVTIGEFQLPRGSIVMSPVYAMHRDSRWFEDPNRFRPKRFQNLSATARRAYMPFGIGRRACVGKHFATMESMVTLVTLLQRHRVELLHGFPVPHPVAKLSLQPKEDVFVRLKHRSVREKLHESENLV